MNKIRDTKNEKGIIFDKRAGLAMDVSPNNQFSARGLYIKEDDQDWGSAGMNNIQSDSASNQ